MLSLIRRTCIFVLGVFIMSLGIAIAVRADLGTTPIASLPTVLSFATNLSVGFYIIVLNMMFFLLQIAILRKRFSVHQLFQIPITLAFGLFIDIGLYLTQWLEPLNYQTQWLWTLVSVILVAIGVYVETLPRLSYLPGNGVVVALTMVQDRLSFGTLKIILDGILLGVSVIMSLILLGGLEGIGEGTIFATLAVGALIRMIASAHKKLTPTEVLQPS